MSGAGGGGAAVGPAPLTGALPFMSSMFEAVDVSGTRQSSIGRDEDVDLERAEESFVWVEGISSCWRLSMVI